MRLKAALVLCPALLVLFGWAVWPQQPVDSAHDALAQQSAATEDSALACTSCDARHASRQRLAAVLADLVPPPPDADSTQASE